MLSFTDFSFNYSTLVSKSPFSPYNDFKIIIKNKEYKFNSMILSNFSNFFFQLFLEDPFLDEIELNFEEGPFEILFDFFLGKNIQISKNNFYFLLDL